MPRQNVKEMRGMSTHFLNNIYQDTVEEIASCADIQIWERSKLRTLEAENARSWQRSKLRTLEAENARSWERSKLRTLEDIWMSA